MTNEEVIVAWGAGMWAKNSSGLLRTEGDVLLSYDLPIGLRVGDKLFVRDAPFKEVQRMAWPAMINHVSLAIEMGGRPVNPKHFRELLDRYAA